MRALLSGMSKSKQTYLVNLISVLNFVYNICFNVITFAK